MRIQLSKMPHETGIDVAALAAACDGFSGAEVVAVCREGGFPGYAVQVLEMHVRPDRRRWLDANFCVFPTVAALLEMRRDPANASSVSSAALFEAARAVTPNITAQMLAFYASYAAAAGGSSNAADVR